MDRHGAIEAEIKFEASTSFYFEEETCLKVSPSMGRRSALDGSAEVTEVCHMRFTKYAIRILALLQDDGMGKGETSTGTGTGSHCRSHAVGIMLPLLSLPSSNADNERVFSMVKKIDTDSRFDLGQDTICALLSCKLNTEDICF